MGSAACWLLSPAKPLTQPYTPPKKPTLRRRRSMLQNLLAKFLDAPWVAAAAAEARRAGSRWVRVHCSWHQRATATGRLSSSNPNLQAVTKYAVTSAVDGFGGGGGAGGAEPALQISIRDAFVAPDGCLLLSADYRRARGRWAARRSPPLIAAPPS